MKNVLITGVSTGIGLGLSKKFISKGFNVIGSVRTIDSANRLKKELGSSFYPLIFDICNTEQISEAAKTLPNIIGKNSLDALINNAGAAEIGPLLHVTKDDFQKQIDILVTGQLLVIQEFYKFLVSKDSQMENGKIINITSISGVNSNYLFGAYSTGKHALEGLSKTLREELKLYDIKLIVVAPGNISTKIWDKQTSEIAEKYRNTDYYVMIKNTIQYISTRVKEDAMSINEFSEAFFKIYKTKSPSNRYTIIKCRIRRIPFSRSRLRVYKK